MAIQLYAGNKAFNEIRQHGLQPQRIKMMVGASGGPKWLMLSRLDQYISGQFLANTDHEISLIGSSIGAWRMALYAQENPQQSFEEFEHLYMHQRYPMPLKSKDISLFVDKVLGQLFTEIRTDAVVNNHLRKLNVVAVRNRRLLSSKKPLMQGLNLASAITSNLVSPGLMEKVFPRVLISPDHAPAPYNLNAEKITLNQGNLRQSLTASAAIPIALQPSKIAGSKDRWHWDGGIVDYHFSGPFNVDDGLVFYPHFSPNLIPGWFDKSLPWRKVKARDYDNVVVLTPSKEFIAKLPYGKIPDRKDFNQLSDNERENFWSQVLRATDQLVDEFHNMICKDGGASAVRPLAEML